MPGLDPAVFDFIDDIVAEAIAGEPIKTDSVYITFGETFFDQFFAALGHSLSGFNTAAKRRALTFVDSLPASAALVEIKLIKVAFEEFCDHVAQTRGNYDGSVVDVDEAIALVRRLLSAAQAWDSKVAAGQSALSSAIADAVGKIGAL